MIRGIRGATTVESNNAEDILVKTEALFRKMVTANGVEAEDVASVYVSMTNDLDAVFPAKALRRLDGWTYVPIMCMAEATVAGALEKCIRVMMHVNTNASQKEVEHIYLEGAVVLRPDLSLTDSKKV
ncbi:chorismate mutase [Bacillaceae bacterium SIJ1]|uniref:chorismate mutase n=1 Tax=Litoribacterium kuwaitense TaxID=1398745 RepID=UPI0013EC0E79|nr:chorismate mutase [Litoribacterium kuwaitense]NGP43709.1 chorismate mutase [Litoribacterium kuwaitense]